MKKHYAYAIFAASILISSNMCGNETSSNDTSVFSFLKEKTESIRQTVRQTAHELWEKSIIKSEELAQESKPTVKNGVQKVKETVQSGIKSVQQTINDGINTISKKTNDAIDTSFQPNNNKANNAKTFSFEWLKNKENTKKFGVGAVAILSFGGISYVLYQNGTIKKIGKNISRYPKATIAAFLASVIGGVAVAHHYELTKDTPIEKVIEKFIELFDKVKNTFVKKAETTA